MGNNESYWNGLILGKLTFEYQEHNRHKTSVKISITVRGSYHYEQYYTHNVFTKWNQHHEHVVLQPIYGHT